MAQKRKRIGFVDYHADNYHANMYLAACKGKLRERGFSVVGCHALREKPSRAWAAANNLDYYSDPAELNEHVDYFAVLAPSNPEAHLELCQRVIPFGKPTYVDKTFAPDTRTAKAIFALADRTGTAVQTTSALRYTNVQDTVADMGGTEAVRHIVTWGGGSSFAEYGIHPLELAISCMGPHVTRVMRRGTKTQTQLLLEFPRGRTAVVNTFIKANTPYAASISTTTETRHVPVDGNSLFVDMADAIFSFFDAGKAQIDRHESLIIRHILDRAEDPAAIGAFVKL